MNIKKIFAFSRSKNGSQMNLMGEKRLKLQFFHKIKEIWVISYDYILDFLNGRAKRVSTCGTDKSVRGKIRSNVRKHMETFNTEDYFIDPFIRWAFQIFTHLSFENRKLYFQATIMSICHVDKACFQFGTLWGVWELRGGSKGESHCTIWLLVDTH